MVEQLTLLRESEYFKIILGFRLSHCEIKKLKEPTVIREDSTWTTLKKGVSTWLSENVLSIEPQYNTYSSENCRELTAFESEINTSVTSIVVYLIIIFLTLVVPFLMVKLFDILDSYRNVKTTSLSSKKPQTDQFNTSTEEVVSFGTTKADLSKDTCTTIPVYNHSFVKTPYKKLVSTCDVASFLKRTVDCLFLELDKLLLARRLKSADPPLSSVVTSSLRTPRRPTLRSTGRRSSSPTISNQEYDDPVDITAFREFYQKVLHKNDTDYIHDVDSFSTESLSENDRKFVNYYSQSCVVNYEELLVSNLIANYSLYLIEKVLQSSNPYRGIKLVQFSRTGSVLKGTKTGQANQFDVHLILQCTEFDIDCAVDHKSDSDVPPGKIVLLAKSVQSTSSKILKWYKERRCLCPHEFLFLACELVETALQKLHKEGRPMIDRLPFRIQRSPSAGLHLLLDTRNVIGLNLPEIKIQVIPSLTVSSCGWMNSFDLYAVPSWSNVDLKRKLTARDRYVNQPPQYVSHDVFWSISYGELEHLYMKQLDRKFNYGNVSGCQRVVIQILKSLFAPQSRKSLLNRGEVTSHMIETVVFFMLLESKPSHWLFAKMSQRVSDAISFLKRALRCGRLPNFFVNNPHLSHACECLQNVRILSPGRQENLIADISSETKEKMLNFIEVQLQENSLVDCITDDYSDDMWEYEYFVYM